MVRQSAPIMIPGRFFYCTCKHPKGDHMMYCGEYFCNECGRGEGMAQVRFYIPGFGMMIVGTHRC
jgi:hypothetical protein